MLKDITEARHVGGHRIWLRFEDGAEGEIDLGELTPFTGVFEPLRDPAYVARLRVERDLGTICWPNDADLDPVVLYAKVTGRTVAELLETESSAETGGAPASAVDSAGSRS